LIYRCKNRQTTASEYFRNVFVTPDGTLVENKLVEALQLDDLVPASGPRPKLEENDVARWLEAAKTVARELVSEDEYELLASTIVWCKFAEGKLSFVIGESTAELTFSGWAQMLAKDKQEPPMFTCPVTGKSSYHITATQDGRMTVAEAMACCEESGRRVLETDLITCEFSGKKALPEYFETCPVSGQSIARSLFETCLMCRQSVSPGVLKNGRCKACRELKDVRREQPRIARLIIQYPKLDGWNKWQISETAKVYVVTARRGFRRLLLVLDKGDLSVLHLATGSTLRPNWKELPKDEWAEYC
jgi:hypothetical protein